MTYRIIFLTVFLFACNNKPKKPAIIFDKTNLTLSIPPPYSFDSIQITNNWTKNSFGIKYKANEVNMVNLYDSIKKHWLQSTLSELDTINYNLYIKINSSDIFKYDLRYGFINLKAHKSMIDTLVELQR